MKFWNKQPTYRELWHRVKVDCGISELATMKQWCQRTKGGKFYMDFNSYEFGNKLVYTFLFERQEDAVLFSLTWS